MNDKKNKTKLFFFTAEYPFAVGETFIENEIGYLAKAFDEVVVLPCSITGVSRELPDGVKVRTVSDKPQFKLTDIFLILKVIFYEFSKVNRRLFFLKKIRTMGSIIKQAVLLSKSIENYIRSEKKDADIIYYSYWMNEWALALAILKDKGIIDDFVFRCGGYDIWDERHEGNYLPFRFYMYSKTSGIYPNSIMGERYLKKFDHYSDKIKCLYWGTSDKGLTPFDKNQIPCIVSCSSIIPLKRVHKIAAIFKKINFPLKWVHFGDGPLRKELIDQIALLPENINVELKGNVRNREVMDYYSKNSVSCFISVSSTESLPVSIQEAISFGIPIVATNVGGVSEIVNDETGLLLDADFDDELTALLIKKTIFDKFSDNQYRKRIRSFWFEKFSAEKNYTEFVKILKSKKVS